MFQFSKYPMDILEMLSGHQAHQFKGLGLERQLSHQQQVQLQHQQQLQQQHQPSADGSGGLLSGLGLGPLQSSRSNAFADSSSLFAKMGAPPPPPSISHQSQSSSSSHGSRKSSKMSGGGGGGGGGGSSGYPQFLRPFHPAEAALAQEQLHSGMGRFDFGGGGGGAGVIGGVVAPAPPPPPLHPGLSVPQPSSGPASSVPSPSTSSASNNPSGGPAVPLVGQSDPRSLHQQFSCMLAANQYFLSGVPTNSSLEQFLVQQGTHNHLGLGLGPGAESNSALAPPPALHSSHGHGHAAPPPQQQQQQLTPHALSHPHGHAHHPHPLHPAPQPPPLGGFDFQGIPVLSSNQLASLMQQEAGLPLPLPLHLSLSKDDAKTGDSSSSSASSGGSRRKKAMAGYLPQRKSETGSQSHGGAGGNCLTGGLGQSSSSGLVGGASGGVGIGGDPPHSAHLSSSSQQSSSAVSSSSSSSSSSAPPSSNSASVLVANGNRPASKSNPDGRGDASSGRPEPEPLYHCGECGKTFTHLSSLRRHLRSHGLTPESQGRKSDCGSPSPERVFCCGECGKRFKKRGHLIQHSVTHSENRPFACAVCQKSFNRRESLTRHEKIHDEKPFRCPACGRCFRESTSLLNHAASGACGKPPRTSKNRVSGGGAGGSKMGGAGGSNREVNPNDGAAMTNDKYAADYSRNRYQSPSAYDDYRRSASSLYSPESDMSNQTLRKAPLAPTLHPHPHPHPHPQSQQPPPPHHHHHHHHHPPPQQPHLPLSSLLDDSEDEVTSSAMSAIAAAAAASCDINTEGREGERRDIIGGLLGGLGFGNMGGPSSDGATVPLTHPGRPHAKRPRKPRDKRDPGHAVRRRRSPAPPGDGSERPYGCQICRKRFRRAETLRRHNRVHTGEKPHACDVCGKTFREPFHLTKHLTVHSGQKNYKCNLCGKMFAYAQSLVRHGKLHRKGEIDGQGRRIKGAAAAAAAAALAQAATSGNPDYFSPCAQGDKSPTSGTPSARLYTCTVCWKSFRHYFHLTAHQQTAHGGGVGLEKSFRCEVCGKAFAYSNSLVRHKLSQHGIERGAPAPPPPPGYSPLFYESGAGYAAASHMQQGNPAQQQQQQQQQRQQQQQQQPHLQQQQQQAPHQQPQHPFHYRSKSQQKRPGPSRTPRKKKRRVLIHSIMRDGKLVGVPLSKDTRRKLLVLRKRRGRLQAQIKKKKILAQLRVKGGLTRVTSWSGGAVRVAGLTSMEVPIKRFPCPICPSATFALPGALLVHRATRHPARSAGRRARLRCQACGRRSGSLLKALRHRGRHLKQAAFQCRRCRRRFWNPALLARHKFCCRGGAAATAHWALAKAETAAPPPPPPPRGASDSDNSPVQLTVAPVLVQPERSTVLTEYSQ
ncbi:Zinc finger protein 865 [Liparis tanakae]|uniref:Zinc finger protein 865 n=1 Tax=Liparis tanakae TaxID=230148 RepID=A0A4Z2FKH2_9TELE|nr:Zinc finger protein 865 [Liparis tanakae]